MTTPIKYIYINFLNYFIEFYINNERIPNFVWLFHDSNNLFCLNVVSMLLLIICNVYILCQNKILYYIYNSDRVKMSKKLLFLGK